MHALLAQPHSSQSTQTISSPLEPYKAATRYLALGDPWRERHASLPLGHIFLTEGRTSSQASGPQRPEQSGRKGALSRQLSPGRPCLSFTTAEPSILHGQVAPLGALAGSGRLVATAGRGCCCLLHGRQALDLQCKCLLSRVGSQRGSGTPPMAGRRWCGCGGLCRRRNRAEAQGGHFSHILIHPLACIASAPLQNT